MATVLLENRLRIMEKHRSPLGIFIAIFTLMGNWGGMLGIASAQGPGLGNLTYAPTEVGKTISLVVNREGHGWVAMHRGYLAVLFSKDGGLGGGAISFLNVSNPRAPQVVHMRDDSVTQTLREPHGWGMRGDIAVLQGNLGMQFWNFADVRNPVRISYLELPLIAISDYDNGLWWTHWQGGYVYGGGSGNGLYIVDARDPANPVFKKRIPTSQTGGFRIGPTHAIGNLLVVSSMDAQGASLLDIGDPENPRLLSVLSPTSSGTASYATMVNGNRLVFAGATIGANANNGRALIYDIRNPSSPTLLGRSAELPAGSGDNKGGYVGFQDQYAFVGFSERGFAKIDLSHTTYPVVSTGTSGLAGRDEDFAVPLGNLVFVANDHPGQGSSLIPHQAGRDTVGPRVNMVVPVDGAVNQALTSRVGATFTDQLDGLTVDSAHFTVRPLGGAPLAGWYAVQNGVVNFQPTSSLQPNTTYEIVVRAGGIRDYSGNTVPETFRSLFSTGANLTTKINTIKSVEASSNPSRVKLNRSPLPIQGGANSKTQYRWKDKQVDAEGRSIPSRIRSNDDASTPN
jgi:hypothetical protein